MVVIEAKNITKTYGNHRVKFNALKQVHLRIKKGESVAIIGKSGSGKSTLMHILALLDQPSAGNVFFNQINVKDLSKREINQLRNRHFGFVFQQFFLNAKDTVLNNVLLPLSIAGISGKKAHHMAVQALKSVGLSEKVHEKAQNLSGGQKQRVCIARALVNQPQIIFADEPTGNLDSETGETIANLLFSLNKKKGLTIIMVTHDPELAARCDRQIRIKDGRIVSDSQKRRDLR